MSDDSIKVPRCGTCQHWSITRHELDTDSGLGRCNAIGFLNFETPAEKKATAYVQDRDGDATGAGGLRTRPEFGCSMHEATSWTE